MVIKEEYISTTSRQYVTPPVFDRWLLRFSGYTGFSDDMKYLGRAFRDIAGRILLTGFLGLGAYNLSKAENEPDSLKTYLMEPVVVTATRTEMPLKELPLSTYVITKDEIESRNSTNLGEALKPTDDIRTYNEGGVATVSLRGSPSSHVRVLRDGVQTIDNNLFTGLTDLSQISVDEAERIEIVKGPTSHLWGSNALGGVINVVTKDPKNYQQNLNASASYGSFNTQRYSIGVGGKTGLIGYTFSGSLRKSDGWRGNDDFDNKSIFAKLTDSGARLKLTAGIYESELGVPGPKPETPTEFGNNEVTTLFDRQKTRNLFAQASYDINLGSRDDLVLNVYGGRGDLNFETKYIDWLTGGAVLNDNDYLAQLLGLSSKLTHRLDPYKTIIIGSEFNREKGDVKHIYTNETSGKVDIIKWNPSAATLSVWTEGILKIPETDLSIFPGIRLDKHSVYGSHISPNIGAALGFGNTNLRASAGRAFRAPSYNELFWPDGGNRDLKPEIGNAYEFGLRHRFSDKLKEDISFFRKKTENMIAWIPTGPGGLWQPDNINEHSLWGLEILTNSNLGSLQAMLHYTYLKGEQKNQEIVYSDWQTGETDLEYVKRDVAFIPRHRFVVDLKYRMPSGLGIGLTGIHRSSRKNYYANYSDSPVITMDEKRLSSRTVFNANLSKGLGDLEFRLDVDDVLNMGGEEQFGNTLGDGNFPLPGRRYTITVGFNR